MGRTVVALAAIGLGVSVCRAADEPTSRPAADSARPAARRLRANFTMAEWNDMMTFLYANSPNRAQVLDHLNLPDSAPIKQELIRKWRAYNFVKEHFPKLADIHVQRYHLEDEIFGLMTEARADPSRRQEIRKSVRSRVMALAQLSVDERKLRVERLEQMLGEEKLRLNAEQDRQSEIIDERMNKIFRNLGQPESLRPAQDGPAQADADQPDNAPLLTVVAMVTDSATLTEGIEDSALN